MYVFNLYQCLNNLINLTIKLKPNEVIEIKEVIIIAKNINMGYINAKNIFQITRLGDFLSLDFIAPST